MSAAVNVSKEHITKTPGVCGGRACVAGHRIRVFDIYVQTTHWKLSPQKILEAYPQLSLAQIHAALAYAFDFEAEMRAIAEADREADEYGKTQPSIYRDAARAMGLLD